MKKIFVSVPFVGRTFEEVDHEMQILKYNYMHKNGYTIEDLKTGKIEFSNNLGYDPEFSRILGVKHPNMRYLANALANMSYCDDAIFSENWESERSCRIEHLAYELYMKESS